MTYASGKPEKLLQVRVAIDLAQFAADFSVSWGYLVAALPLIPPGCIGGEKQRVNVKIAGRDLQHFNQVRKAFGLSEARLIEAACAYRYAREKSFATSGDDQADGARGDNKAAA
jgi:hypothetical protein